MTTVVVAEVAASPGRSLDIERDILGSNVEVTYYIHGSSEDELINACKHADVILTDYAPFSRAVLSTLGKCRLISVAATGFDSIDLDAAREFGISVCAIDEYCTDEVADHTILLMLALCRRLPEYHDQVQKQDRWQFDSLLGLRRLSEMTLGLVGFGRIGRAVAERAQGFGLTILAFDPFVDGPAETRADVEMCSLDTIFSNADIISLHCGLGKDNKALLDRAAFERMKKAPVIINCARGALIDEAALAVALDNGQVAAAGLDVLCDETPDLDASPLLNRNNVILTPHMAFYSDASMLANRKISAQNIRYFLDGHNSKVDKFIVLIDGANKTNG